MLTNDDEKMNEVNKGGMFHEVIGRHIFGPEQ